MPRTTTYATPIHPSSLATQVDTGLMLMGCRSANLSPPPSSLDRRRSSSRLQSTLVSFHQIRRLYSDLIEFLLGPAGILNQEAQCLSDDGVHVLNRELVSESSTWCASLSVTSEARTAD